MKEDLNGRSFYSIVLMSLVDAEYSFIWASVGVPVNTHDSTPLQSTDPWKIIVGREVIPNSRKILKYHPLFWVTEPSYCEHLC